MRLLLDTHIWIWSLGASSKLLKRVAHALDDPNNDLWLSPISIWELTILNAKGRTASVGRIEDWIANALRASPMREAPITSEVALATNQFRPEHPDPADAFLAATAKVYDLTLVTSDAALLASKEIATLVNR